LRFSRFNTSVDAVMTGVEAVLAVIVGTLAELHLLRSFAKLRVWSMMAVVSLAPTLTFQS
jgi:hypothetical protein